MLRESRDWRTVYQWVPILLYQAARDGHEAKHSENASSNTAYTTSILWPPQITVASFVAR
jgi:hypothetical protein